ncbi:MAG: hypothetical protein ACLGIZ_16255 [Acidimicrobiia bacterium]
MSGGEAVSGAPISTDGGAVDCRGGLSSAGADAVGDDEDFGDVVGGDGGGEAEHAGGGEGDEDGDA